MPRFEASLDTILSHLSSVMGKMHDGTSGWEVEFGDRMSKVLRISLSRIGCGVASGVPSLWPRGVAISFTRAGVVYRFHCEKYDDTRDNFRATQQAISWMWRIYEDYGVVSGDATTDASEFDRIFGGHRATPLALPERWDNWWEVIGVTRDTPLDEIERRYRAQMKAIHTDLNGENGSGYLMRALNAAIKMARHEKGQ